MLYDAFISYRRDNGFFMAQVIRDRLKEKGVYCFLDLEELNSGKFDTKILVAIKEAESFILILPKNALNRCADEDDWVRKEILAAVQYNKTIIPVMYDGFKWPKKWNENIPNEIRALENTNAISGTQEYLAAMIDKIISYMPENIKIREIKKQENFSITEFFKNAFDRMKNVVSVDMAFHAGAEWRQSSEKINWLSYMIENNIKLRILANTEEVVGKITESMTQPLKRYTGYEECLKDWTNLEKAYPDIISVHVSDVPLLHRIYSIHGKNDGIINIKYYTYRNCIPEDDFRMSFGYGTKEYDLYNREFEYLWEHSSKYEMER